PPEDVRADLLEPSDTVTRCAYKGLASYHSARVNGDVVADVAWSYPEPLTEATRVAGYLCFSDEHADIELDGQGQ
ncbi:MAG: DUF427 domain-containing protein, partial [Nitriliruptorales bacterium]|nr:DUF427 domain-containing protein [Nitriliruptorales bacterium]